VPPARSPISSTSADHGPCHCMCTGHVPLFRRSVFNRSNLCIKTFLPLESIPSRAPHSKVPYYRLVTSSVIDEYWKLKARVRHQLELCISESPGVTQRLGSALFAQAECTTGRAGKENAVTAKRCSLVALQHQYILGAESEKASSNRPSRVYGLRYV
jgi:hypothetical protein